MVKVPMIGIGAGNAVDGQVLVAHDMFGITREFSPRFLRRYLDMGDQMERAVKQYIADVKNRDFPNDKEQY
jgi:3-methyl-2-oxobutanoate hydroxymethyltransferase